MKTKHGLFFDFAVLALTAMFALAGCGNPAGDNSGGGGGVDSGLVAKWYSTQAAANAGGDPVFEIDAGGNFTYGTAGADAVIKVATSDGRISATTTASGTTVDTGSAAYVVEETTLTLSDLSGSPNTFSPLYNAGGKFYKKAGGGGGDGGDGGDGGGGAPIEISTLAELNNISADSASLSKNYKLMANITGVTTPIGDVSGSIPIPFTGDFDGNGHTITINITNGLTITGGPIAGSFAGLFAFAGAQSGDPGTSGTVHDLTVKGTINITGTALYAGGVIGAMLPSAEVKNVASSVNITASGSNVYAGGIAGASQGAVSNVYATGNVLATTSGAKSVYAGGVVGTGAVSYAYATGNVSASATGTGPGTGDHSVTVGAGGIAGAASNNVVRNTVALNSAISASGNNYNRCSYRITSTSTGTVTTNDAANYGKADLIPSISGSGGDSHSNNEGADREDGVDVTVTVTGGPLPAVYTAPIKEWWTETGFEGADWTTVWQWDTATGLPKLRTAE
jgi:hypothetical protein